MGDCVNCSLCVQVCPTGIDIREGLQYMCIGCGACVDVCDQVMDKMNYDKGLIRYTSGRAITERLTQSDVRQKMLRPRVLIYIGLLAFITAMFVFSLATRHTLRMDVIRDRGVLGREIPGGYIENIYRLQLMNTAETPLVVELSAGGIPGITISTVNQDGNRVTIPAASNELIPVHVQIPIDLGLSEGMHDVEITAQTVVEDGSRSVETVSEASRFYVPR